MTDDEIRSHILAVRGGPGANCSSVGSAVEMLFLSASAGVAILAAASAALRPTTDAHEAPEAPPVDDTEARGDDAP